MGSQVFGNLIAALMLGNFPQIAYVLLMLGIMCVSVFILFFLKTPIKNVDSAAEEEEETPASIPIALLKLGKMFISIRFLAIFPQIFWAGMSIAFYSGLLVNMLSLAVGGDEAE